jgi:hypothetical protein
MNVLEQPYEGIYESDDEYKFQARIGYGSRNGPIRAHDHGPEPRVETNLDVITIVAR